MQIGATFPNDALGADAGAVRAFAQDIEGMGFDFLDTFDHVLGASAAHYDNKALPGPYREHNVFHEPFVLFGYLAGLTKTLRFATTVLILSQRQTVLVAKQAAEVDFLSGGRLRLGIGSGWNTVEYESLGMPWNKRGRMIEEQIKLLRALWTQPVVEFRGEFHTVAHAGLNPMPIQRPIPIWLGGISEAVVDRCGRVGDGWLPQFSVDTPGAKSFRTPVDPVESVTRLRRIASEAGRDPMSVGLECRIVYAGGKEAWHDRYSRYRDLGATHISFSTLGDVPDTPDAHLRALREMKDELGL